MAVIGERFPCPYLTGKPFVVFSVPHPFEEGSDGAALVGTWHPAKVNQPQRFFFSNNSLPVSVLNRVPMYWCLRSAHCNLFSVFLMKRKLYTKLAFSFRH